MDRGVPEYGGVVDPAGERARCLRQVRSSLRDLLVGGITDHRDHPWSSGVVIDPGQRALVELDCHYGAGLVQQPLDHRPAYASASSRHHIGTAHARF